MARSPAPDEGRALLLRYTTASEFGSPRLLASHSQLNLEAPAATPVADPRGRASPRPGSTALCRCQPARCLPRVGGPLHLASPCSRECPAHVCPRAHGADGGAVGPKRRGHRPLRLGT